MKTTTLQQQLADRPIEPTELTAMVDALRSQVRAYRLREIREAQSITQIQVAEELGVGQNRVSAIERGDIDRAQISTLRRYIESLGGRLSIEAQFGDAKYVIG